MYKEQKNIKGDEDMGAVVNAKPIQAMEVNFKSDKEYKDFMEFVENPPAASTFVKNLIKDYQKQDKESSDK